jgi:hypothetical protein
MAGLPLFISFSTSYRELDSAVRHPTRRIGKLRGGGCFSVAQAALLQTKHRKSIDNPGEEWLSPWATGNERFVAHPEITPFWSYFLVAGDPTGIVGDEDFPASHAR